ncbi:MAG: ABC transporter ATP-binding protein [Acidimicrobiaceae bacterium]|nr:ABC transporter ATP-binding protein [Acidimicrobiaceae bacterium]
MSGKLSISELSVNYRLGEAKLLAVNALSFAIPAGHRIAVVGESGSGKSTLGLALMGLLPRNAEVIFENLELDDSTVNMNNLSEVRALRGRKIAMVFQDAKASLDPLRTIGSQITEVLKVHEIVSSDQFESEVHRLLTQVEIPRPELVARQYPHELSGGMRQRAMIAAALAGRPSLLIADEPTSALDVTTQATVIDLLRRLSESGEMSTMLITHDLALVASFAQSVMVLYAGNIVETGSVDEIYSTPSHPYTKALLAAIPNIWADRKHELDSIEGTLPDLTEKLSGCVFEPRCTFGKGRDLCKSTTPEMKALPTGGRVACHFSHEVRSVADIRGSATQVEVKFNLPSTDASKRLVREFDRAIPVVRIQKVSKTFRRGSLLAANRSQVIAVRDVDLLIHEGESVGLVGESGSGKTTLARLIVELESKDSGSIFVHGSELQTSEKKSPKGDVQFIFQDPGDSLNPVMTIEQIISEPLVLRDGGKAKDFRDNVARLLVEVGLRESMARRRPSELSGGQRQRIAIARAISTDPKLIIADEAVASLDMSARGQILNLLASLQRAKGFSYLYISHDLSTVRHVCDRVAVMYRGRIVETGSADEIFVHPEHPYMQALISAVPVPDPKIERTRQRIQKVNNMEFGSPGENSCAYIQHCDLAREKCSKETPYVLSSAEHGTACHYASESAERFSRD